MGMLFSHVRSTQTELRSFALASYGLFAAASINLFASVLRSSVTLDWEVIVALAMIYLAALVCQIIVGIRLVRGAIDPDSRQITLLHVKYSNLLSAIVIASTLILRR